MKRPPEDQDRQIRCAIYARKSTQEGLQQQFNSLDAQRDAAEAYVATRKSDGWVALKRRYEDGGFSGANMDRPALKELLDDIRAGQVDCVLVYKVDRLSRSLLDFAKMIETFDQAGVSFVSVTQQIDTATSMGRLMLHVLLSFAQFERELISERTRDKMAAARRRGQWLGSYPILGYDIVQRRLCINPTEAERVRAIFRLYLEHGSLIPTVTQLAKLGWSNKRWTTRSGKVRGGLPFNKVTLRYLLVNVTYIGLVRHKDQLFPGQHEAIVPADLFQRVANRLRQNGHPKTAQGQRTTGLLDGLLFCGGCQCPMQHTYSRKGQRRYRYYVCTHAQKSGYQNCPEAMLPAPEIERVVLSQLQDTDSRFSGFATDQQVQLVRHKVQRVDYLAARGGISIQLSGDPE